VPQAPPAVPAPIATEEDEAPAAPAAPPAGGPRQAPVRAAQAERPVHRTVLVDYGYVTRDLRSILILATIVIIAIVVLSFFLP
jgi:hypothetical protein